jgi:hypothetical protein
MYVGIETAGWYAVCHTVQCTLLWHSWCSFELYCSPGPEDTGKSSATGIKGLASSLNHDHQQKPQLLQSAAVVKP